jgi:hypothetical protein
MTFLCLSKFPFSFGPISLHHVLAKLLGTVTVDMLFVDFGGQKYIWAWLVFHVRDRSSVYIHLVDQNCPVRFWGWISYDYFFNYTVQVITINKLMLRDAVRKPSHFYQKSVVQWYIHHSWNHSSKRNVCYIHHSNTIPILKLYSSYPLVI